MIHLVTRSTVATARSRHYFRCLLVYPDEQEPFELLQAQLYTPLSSHLTSHIAHIEWMFFQGPSNASLSSNRFSKVFNQTLTLTTNNKYKKCARLYLLKFHV